MKTSIATVSLSGSLEEKLEAIAAAGFDGVEIFENDFLSFDAGPRDVGRMLADLGLACVAFQPFRDFEGLPEPERSRAFERAERKFDVMQELGAELMLVCSNCSPAALGGLDRAAADFHALGEQAAARGLRIGYEALAWGRHVNDHRDAWEVVRRADHPNVGLILDTFHSLARALPVGPIAAIPGERIFLVQVADAPSVQMDLLSWSRHLRSLPGQGELPLGDFMQALLATGYDGWLSLEIFNDRFRAGAARQTATDGQRSLHFLLDRCGALQPPLPPRPRPLGVEFLEFAVDEGTGAELVRLFGQLGFRKAGRHRSKAVTLFKQGAINLVVNCDKEGFAQSSYVVHGPGVCAMGLRIDDAGQAMERSRRLGAQTFEQAVGPGELEIPAIRGVGGSLLYFTDAKSDLARLWEIDFELLPGSAEDDAGLARVDHVAQAMSHEEMLSWLLAYTAFLELEKSPELDIADPGGLVHSQVVRAPDEALRIVLNSSESPKTLSGRFIEEFFGSGVQHIAFETSDILACARAMRERGLETLPIPRNYYDDLAARFDLEEATLEQLRSLGVLYDRDESGAYFQIYTRSFAGRLFFEIVERRGYRGFGAANAPIRLTAQQRSGAAPAA